MGVDPEHFQKYPYDPKDGRKDPEAKAPRVLRGGAFYGAGVRVRCVFRFKGPPDHWDSSIGFRVVLSPFFSGL